MMARAVDGNRWQSGGGAREGASIPRGARESSESWGAGLGWGMDDMEIALPNLGGGGGEVFEVGTRQEGAPFSFRGRTARCPSSQDFARPRER